jgi:hypothetical protein
MKRCICKRKNNLFSQVRRQPLSQVKKIANYSTAHNLSVCPREEKIRLDA